MSDLRWQVVAVGVLCLSSPTKGAANTWQWQRIAWGGTAVWSVTCPVDSADVLYATLSPWGSGLAPVGVQKSPDGGVTWRELSESVFRWPFLLSSDPKHGATIYCGSAAADFESRPPRLDDARRSRDAGIHWETLGASFTRIVAGPHPEGSLFAFDEPQGGWALYRSVDHGETWQFLSGAEDGGMADDIEFDPLDPELVWACMYTGSCGSYGLCKSNDSGLTWEVSLEGIISAFGQDSSDNGHLAAVVAGDPYHAGLFAETIDGGASWQTRELPMGIRRVAQLLFDRGDPNTIYLVDPIAGYDQHLGVYRSLDGGGSWEPMNDGLPPGTHTWQLFQTSGQAPRLLAARGDGLWWWTDQQAGEWADRRAAFRLEGIGPCPFREGLSGRVLLGQAGHVAAGVYSLDGRLIRTLLDSPLSAGVHVLTWDGLSQAGEQAGPGVVVLRVHSGEAVVSRPVVKLP